MIILRADLKWVPFILVYVFLKYCERIESAAAGKGRIMDSQLSNNSKRNKFKRAFVAPSTDLDTTFINPPTATTYGGPPTLSSEIDGIHDFETIADRQLHICSSSAQFTRDGFPANSYRSSGSGKKPLKKIRDSQVGVKSKEGDSTASVTSDTSQCEMISGTSPSAVLTATVTTEQSE
ncbi:hypothetical protein RB195_015571 [Necator americanus]|uniref:Uncharacterized protein n=1 Tax=Necator americanus TaxID=51031 RepID=A0ABR1E5D4_NECAM